MSPTTYAADTIRKKWGERGGRAFNLPSPCRFEHGEEPTPEESLIMARFFARVRNMDSPVAVVINAIIEDVMSDLSSTPTFSEVYALFENSAQKIGLNFGQYTFCAEWGESIIDEILRIANLTEAAPSEVSQ